MFLAKSKHLQSTQSNLLDEAFGPPITKST